MMNRRNFLELSLGAGALALTPELLRAFEPSHLPWAQSGTLIQRTIPSSGERIPVLGLAFSNHPSCADRAALTQIVKMFAEAGGRYYDATLGNAANQQFHIDTANELAVSDKLFWSTTSFVPGPGAGPAGVKTQIDATLARTKTSHIDVAWVTAAGDPAILAAVREEKKAGRVRHIGVMTIVVNAQAAQLETLMRNEPIDLIGVDFDISNRSVEDTILPLAQEKKIGVIAYLPFNNASGASCAGTTRLFARVAKTPLPEWAAEFDATNWAQFFLKYVISHPAVTVARTGTTKVAHMAENLGGGVGRLPDEPTRRRMAAFIDALPQPAPPAPPKPAPGIALSAAVLDRYVGEYKAAGGFTAIFRREGTSLWVKPGNNPEVALLARSETRFQDPRGPHFEFQLDAQGKVTGAVLEQQGPQGTQKVPLTPVR